MVDMSTIGGRMKDKGIGYRLGYLTQQFRVRINEMMKPYDIGFAECNILRVLSKNEGSSQEELAKTLQIDKAAVARAIKGMEQKEYIIREKSKEDSRNYCVYMTEKSKALLPIIDDKFHKNSLWLIEGIDEQALEITLRTLDEMCANTKRAKESE